jgi:FKBP-type peptidyl-prolyl cis-trans isomerase
MASAPIVGAQTPAAGPAGAPPAAADTSPEQTGYLFGLTFGEQLHNVGITNQVSPADIERGIKDALAGKKATRADQQQVQQFVQGVMAQAAVKNKQAAQDFLAKNSKEKAVKTTADGLQYKVISAGDGKAPAVSPTDEVTVNYRGKLLDGTEFDSSYSRGQPATFRVNGVIKGWQEALVLMKPGAKYELFVPPELGYGDQPRPGIPAGSLLEFEVELISAKSNAAPAASAAPGSTAPAAGPAKKDAKPAGQSQ